jgi:hypothetical protein
MHPNPLQNYPGDKNERHKADELPVEIFMRQHNYQQHQQQVPGHYL